MDNKKNGRKSRIVSPAALAMLFGAAFVGDASAMEPVVNNSVGVDVGTMVALTQNQNQNQNQNKTQITSALKPLALRSINSGLSIG